MKRLQQMTPWNLREIQTYFPKKKVICPNLECRNLWRWLNYKGGCQMSKDDMKTFCTRCETSINQKGAICVLPFFSLSFWLCRARKTLGAPEFGSAPENRATILGLPIIIIACLYKCFSQFSQEKQSKLDRWAGIPTNYTPFSLHTHILAHTFYLLSIMFVWNFYLKYF